MNCKKCGNPITPFDKFCQFCGEQNENYTGGNTVETPVVPTESVQPTEPVQPAQPVETQTQGPVQENIQQPIQPVINSNPIDQKKKGNGAFIALIIIMAIIILGLGGFIAYKYLFPADTKENDVTKNTNKQNVVDTKKVTNTDTDTIELDGYTFTKPSDLNYDETKKAYYNSNLMLTMQIVLEPYENALMEKDELLSVVQSKIPTATYSESMYGNRKYMVYSGVVSGYNMDVFITSVDDETCVMGALILNKSYDRTSAYTYLNKIFDTSKGSVSSTFAKQELKTQAESIEIDNNPSFE